MRDPMTEAQGDEINGLLKKIPDRLASIGEDTTSLSRMETTLDHVEKDVSEILGSVLSK
jgi:hypothetical protein